MSAGHGRGGPLTTDRPTAENPDRKFESDPRAVRAHGRDDREDSPSLTREQARELVDSVKVSLGAIEGALVTAYRGRAWLALGHPSWDALCTAEFAGARLRIPREDRADQVVSLREAGMPVRAIAAGVGSSKSQVQRDLARVPDGTPAVVTGEDGKRYPTTPAPRIFPEPVKRTPRRRPITDTWREGSYEAERAVEKLLRLVADDRFSTAHLLPPGRLKELCDQLFAAVAEKEAGR